MKALGRLGWALVGGMVVLVAAISLWPEPIYYPEVVVPEGALRDREVPFGAPGPWDIGQRIVYVYVQPDVRAVAPGAVKMDVSAFCHPVVVAQTGGVAQDVQQPTPSLIRTGTLTPSLIPFGKAHLFLSSMNGYGDLIGEDFGVRLPVGFSAGLEKPYVTTVRYPRWAAPVDYARGALEIYGAIRFLLDVVP